MRLEQIPWKGPDKPTESALAARLAADGFESFLWIDPPDADYSPHAHDHDESLWAIDGEITPGAEGPALRPGPGDRPTLPKGTIHAARAPPQGARSRTGGRPGRAEPFWRPSRWAPPPQRQRPVSMASPS